MKSMGITLDDSQNAALEAATTETDFAPFFAIVNNGLSSYQQKTKDTGRSEVYDEFKAILRQTFGDSLDVNFYEEIKNSKGKDSFQKSLNSINQQILDLKKSKKGKTEDQKDDIDAQIAALNANILQLKEQHKNELAQKEEQFGQQKLESELAMEILMKGQLDGPFKSRDFINRMMTPTVLDMMKADGVKFSDGLKVVDENGNVKYDKSTNKPIDVTHYITKAGEPYAIKSQTPTPGQSSGQGVQGQSAPSRYGQILAGVAT